MFDIVIPIGPNDKEILGRQLEYTKRNVIGYRNIYLISYDPAIQEEGCITVDEKLFPFSMDTVYTAHGPSSRGGWYLQQLLKLYAGFVVPGILERYLVIDADTFFLKPTEFVDAATGKCMYAYGTEHHVPYFEHMQRMASGWRKIDNTKSGICSHMMFETKYVKEILNAIEHGHNKPFYNVFLEQVSSVHYIYSGASEYEMYFNYMLQFHPSEIIVRELKWSHANQLNEHCDDVFQSVHWYIRA